MAESEPAFANTSSSQLETQKSREQLELKEILHPDIEVITPGSPFGDSKAHKQVQFKEQTTLPEAKSGSRRKRAGPLQIGSTVKWPKKFLKRGSTDNAPGQQRVEDDGASLSRAATVRDSVRRGSNADSTPETQSSHQLCMKKPYINLHQVRALCMIIMNRVS